MVRIAGSVGGVVSEYTAMMEDIHKARRIAWRANENCEQLDPSDILDVLGQPDDTEIRHWKQEQE